MARNLGSFSRFCLAGLMFDTLLACGPAARLSDLENIRIDVSLDEREDLLQVQLMHDVGILVSDDADQCPVFDNTIKASIDGIGLELSEDGGFDFTNNNCHMPLYSLPHVGGRLARGTSTLVIEDDSKRLEMVLRNLGASRSFTAQTDLDSLRPGQELVFTVVPDSDSFEGLVVRFDTLQDLEDESNINVFFVEEQDISLEAGVARLTVPEGLDPVPGFLSIGFLWAHPEIEACTGTEACSASVSADRFTFPATLVR